MTSFDSMQNEILNESGHQEWHKVTVHDFGDKNIEVSVMPYETWAEFDEEDIRPKSKRGEGDRERSAESAAKRAKRRVRHKCKMLKARYMLTLTTKKIITDSTEFQKLFQEFVRRIRKVADFQYVATLEFQQREALHMHIAVANRQDYKLLWAIWFSIVGRDQGRVHGTKGNQKTSVNRIAGYISKYITKSFAEGELNKRRYWASKGIGEPVKTVHLLRKDWEFGQVLSYIVEICNEKGVPFDLTYSWCQGERGLFWIAASN